jgi:hypothetical protein
MSSERRCYQLLSKYKNISAIFVIFSLIYILQTLFLHPVSRAMQEYHPPVGQAKDIALALAIPYIIVWFVALLGYLGLHDYSLRIVSSKDGLSFHKISQGILILSIWLPLSAIIGILFRQIYVKHTGSTAGLVIVNNYLNVAALIPAFILINQGAKKLVPLTKVIRRPSEQKLLIAYICFAVIYVWIVLSDPARRVPTSTISPATYYEPDWLIITTIIIPRLIMWFLGAQAVQCIYFYKQKVKGTIYKASLRNLAYGIGWIVIASIVLRINQSVTIELQYLSMGLLIAVRYLILILVGIGYVLLSKGSEKLQYIENT